MQLPQPPSAPTIRAEMQGPDIAPTRPALNLNWVGSLVLVCSSLFFVAFIGFADTLIGRDLDRQYASTHFSVAAGTITHSEITRHYHKGTTYGVDLRYQYRVGDRIYQGNRYRYYQGGSSNYGWADFATRQHPVGSATPVYYNPADPADALLAPGINGADLFMVIALTPFNMAAIGVIAASVANLLRRFRPRAGGVPITRDLDRTLIRLPRWTPLGTALLTAGALAFVTLFALAFTTGGHPSTETACRALGSIYGAAFLVWLWQLQQLLAGARDLVLDHRSRTAQLPKTFGRKQRTTVGFSDIEEVTVRTITKTSQKSGTSYTYAPTLRLRATDEKLAEWSNQARAQAFTDWLRQELAGSNPS